MLLARDAVDQVRLGTAVVPWSSPYCTSILAIIALLGAILVLFMRNSSGFVVASYKNRHIPSLTSQF